MRLKKELLLPGRGRKGPPGAWSKPDSILKRAYPALQALKKKKRRENTFRARAEEKEESNRGNRKGTQEQGLAAAGNDLSFERKEARVIEQKEMTWR